MVCEMYWHTQCEPYRRRLRSRRRSSARHRSLMLCCTPRGRAGSSEAPSRASKTRCLHAHVSSCVNQAAGAVQRHKCKPADCAGLMPTPSAQRRRAQSGCVSVFVTPVTRTRARSGRAVGDDGARGRRNLELRDATTRRVRGGVSSRPRRRRVCRTAAHARRRGTERARPAQPLAGVRQRAGRASSAANFSTAVKGASSGTLKLRGAGAGAGAWGTQRAPQRSTPLAAQQRGASRGRWGTHTRNGSLGSDVSVTLNVTLAPLLAISRAGGGGAGSCARRAGGASFYPPVPLVDTTARPCAHARLQAGAWRAAAPGAAAAARRGDVTGLAGRARGAAARPHAGRGRGARRHGAGGSGGRQRPRDRRRNGCVRATRSAEGCSDARCAAAGKSSWSFSSGTPLLQSSLTWTGGADGRVPPCGVEGTHPRAAH